MKYLRLALGLVLIAPILVFARSEYKIVTASERGTYIQIGHDLAKWVADAADIGLEVLPSKGSADNVQRLRFEPDVKLALVQSDVYQAFLDRASAGDKQAMRIIRPLRVILPLYNEEIYFVTRADSSLQFIHQIKGKKINVGPVGSGTALSATTLYRLMFGEALPENNASYLSNEDALAKLATDKSLDVAVIVAGQPATLFTDMKPEARQYIKFLKLDAAAKEAQQATRTYFPATIRASSYPSWLAEDVPTLTVKSFLVTYDYQLPSTQADLTRFAGTLCDSFQRLQGEGHPKWKDVKMELPPLGRGWQYYAPMSQVLRTCADRQSAALKAATQAARSCSQQERVLALCQDRKPEDWGASQSGRTASKPPLLSP